jgi:hypothetical protein
VGSARKAHCDAAVVRGAQDGGHAGVEGEVLAVAVAHVGAGFAGAVGGFEGRGDVRVDPEGPQRVVQVEDDEGGQGERVGECGGY